MKKEIRITILVATALLFGPLRRLCHLRFEHESRENNDGPPLDARAALFVAFPPDFTAHGQLLFSSVVEVGCRDVPT